LLRLLFHYDKAGQNPLEAEKYKEYFIDIGNRLEAADENSAVKKEDLHLERGIAAAVFYKANKIGRGGGERVARLFDVSSSTLRKFVKLLDKLFE
jgi:hypothetical protein